MLKDLTRSKLIQRWLAAVALVVVASVALGAAVTPSTAALLVALSVVPTTITFMLWPGRQPATVAEVLYGAERRG